MTVNQTQETNSGEIHRAAARYHSKALEMARRGLELVQGKTTDRMPTLHTEPVENYLDEKRFRAEIDVLFRANPVFAGMSAELPSAGSYKTLDIPTFPLLVVRGQDGVVHAFLNVCRHRAASLAEGSGTARAFVCKYHGWTYGLDGGLRKVRAAESFGELDLGCNGLLEVPAAERYGLIFVRATPIAEGGAPINVDDVLSGLGPQMDAWRFDLVDQFQTTRTIETAANWKLSLDTYLETYHFITLHKTTVAKSNHSDHTPFDAYGRHALNAFTSLNIANLAEIPPDKWEPMKYVQLVYLLFPNTVMTVMQDHVEYSMILPGATVDKNKMIHAYFTLPEYDNVHIHSERFDRTHWILKEEDCPMSEEMQHNVASGGPRSLTFGRNEPGVQHAHRGFVEALVEAGR